MESKYTPGPWEVDEQGMIYQCDSPDDEAKLICDCAQDPITGPTEEELANAALIAAAPELLEALEWITAFAEEHSEWFGAEDGSEAEWLNKARAAIAKAAVGRRPHRRVPGVSGGGAPGGDHLGGGAVAAREPTADPVNRTRAGDGNIPLKD